MILYYKHDHLDHKMIHKIHLQPFTSITQTIVTSNNSNNNDKLDNNNNSTNKNNDIWAESLPTYTLSIPFTNNSNSFSNALNVCNTLNQHIILNVSNSFYTKILNERNMTLIILFSTATPCLQ